MQACTLVLGRWTKHSKHVRLHSFLEAALGVWSMEDQE